MTRRRLDQWTVAVAIDTFAVVAFVAIGRRNHDEDPGVGGLLVTVAPFLIGLAIGWGIALAIGAARRPLAVRAGLVIAVVTVVAGMALRRFVFDEGTALSFVVVATSFVVLTLVGWRAVATRLRLRSAHA